MRLATYTQPSVVPRGSLLALFVLVLTIVLGSSALHTLMTHFAPQLHTVIAALWLITYLVAFMGLMFGHGINWISWLSRYRILLVILLLGTIISVSWSLDAATSAERVVHLVGCSVLAIYLGFMIPLLTTLRVTAVVLGAIILASLAAAMLMPSVGQQDYEGAVVWSGIFNSKNALGFWAAIAVLLYITLSASTQNLFLKLMCFVFAGISVFVLLKSDSATSLLAMLVAGSLSLYLYLAFRFQLGFVRMVVLALLIGGLLGFALSNIDTAQIVGRSGDLTGRSEVWRQTWKLIMAKPLTGYGYGSIWFPNDATLWMQQSLTDFTWVVYHAHNGFLQVASEIGLPLSCIALLMVVQQLIEIFYCQYQRQQVGVLFVLAFVVAYLIGNFSEARFLVNRELYWIFFIALPISMLRQINLKSVEVEDYEDEEGLAMATAGGYSYAEVPPDKPWLRPIAQTEAARIGAATAIATSSHNADMDVGSQTQNNRTVDATSAMGFHDETDINLGGENVHGSDFDLGEYSVTESGDHTLDTTQSILLDRDSTMEVISRQDTDDARSVIDSVIDSYDEYDDEYSVIDDGSSDDYVIADTHVDLDRYDKKIDDAGVDDDHDDDDEYDDEWVDISLDE